MAQSSNQTLDGSGCPRAGGHQRRGVASLGEGINHLLWLSCSPRAGGLTLGHCPRDLLAVSWQEMREWLFSRGDGTLWALTRRDGVQQTAFPCFGWIWRCLWSCSRFGVLCGAPRGAEPSLCCAVSPWGLVLLQKAVMVAGSTAAVFKAGQEVEAGPLRDGVSSKALPLLWGWEPVTAPHTPLGAGSCRGELTPWVIICINALTSITRCSSVN